MEIGRKPVSVAETTLFIRQARDIWSEDERSEFVDFIASNPEIGDLIQDTGGVRKVRWKRQGSGKRGGVRVIYYFHSEDIPLYLLMAFVKSDQTDLSADQKKAVVRLTTELKETHLGKR